MSVLIDSARSAVFRDGQIIIAMRSGSEIRFPAAQNSRLARGTPEQLSRIELLPYGIHWPELDEDLSFEGLLRGDYGQHQEVESGRREVLSLPAPTPPDMRVRIRRFQSD